ncbi:hypothetical protein KM043_010983 [Ampulex compressa]|nr:hypothetical protein KM043_010983 [Ampulex compressa]
MRVDGDGEKEDEGRGIERRDPIGESKRTNRDKEDEDGGMRKNRDEENEDGTCYFLIGSAEIKAQGQGESRKCCENPHTIFGIITLELVTASGIRRASLSDLLSVTSDGYGNKDEEEEEVEEEEENDDDDDDDDDDLL